MWGGGGVIFDMSSRSVLYRQLALNYPCTGVQYSADSPLGTMWHQLWLFVNLFLLRNTAHLIKTSISHRFLYKQDWLIWFIVFNATFSNISAISWQPLFCWWKKPEYPERTTDHGQATGKLYHLRLRVECTCYCNLQSRARTHAILVIGACMSC